MAIYKMNAWCVVQQTKRGEQFAGDVRAFEPLRHALYIAVSYNEANARVLLEEGRRNNPNSYADARIVPVVVEVREREARKPRASRIRNLTPSGQSGASGSVWLPLVTSGHVPW